MNSVSLPKKQPILVWSTVLILAAFAVGNVYAITQDFWWLSAVPVGLALVAFALLKPHQFWLLMVFLTPVSVTTDIADLGIGLTLPTEPFIAFFMVLIVLKFLLENKIDWKVVKHPITIIILLQLVWMLVSSTVSTLPMVSFKYFLSRLWYVIVFYFFGIQVFKDLKRIDQYNWFYLVSMCAVIIYSLVRHYFENFSHEYSYKASLPFFKDHNIYAVIVAFYIPVGLIYALKARTFKISFSRGLVYYFISAVFLIGVVASYTRAAWVSLGVALIMYAALRLKLRLRTLLAALLGVCLVVLASWTDIMLYMSKNKAESDSNLDSHVQSIYNVTSDDSNTERLNRWNAAIRMFQERPVFGFGPNTYQFKYAPYQLSHQKTRISTNLGDLGNAHSEFIGPLAEMGLLGALLVIALMLAAIRTAMHIFYDPANDRVKYLSLVALLAFMTYYSHGLLNNYLDTDKANVCFWATMAIITALEVHHNGKKEKEDESASAPVLDSQ